MLQYIEHKDLSFPQGRGGALVKGFLKKTLAECAEPVAAAPAKQVAPAGIALTEGLFPLHFGCSVVCLPALADTMLKLLSQGKQVQKWENVDLERLLAAKGLKDFFDVEEWPNVNAVRELATRVKKAADAMASGSDKPSKPFVFTGMKQCELLDCCRLAACHTSLTAGSFQLVCLTT